MPDDAANPPPLRLAMIGMVPGNGHPYSWSAIINGYDRDLMAACPYPVIGQYLNAQPAGSVGLPHAAVTHIWTDDPADARLVAPAALIPHILACPEDAIGQVDAVFIATDDGYTHVARARPFIEAGLPVFIDKPLALTVEDLRTFIAWRSNGARLLSSSGLRFAPEFDALLADPSPLGELRWLSGLTCKAWETYGIHALEPLFRFTGPGYSSILLESQPGLEVAHLQHHSGVQVTIPVIADGGAAFGTFQLTGTAGPQRIQLKDTYTAFHRQIVSFLDYVRTGTEPCPFAHTIELMALLIGGIRSREEGSRRVDIPELLSLLNHRS
ncbi:Gfo/Idh/MocA family protein [Actomonas aquatica]|uniref:Gfo/Idh/MocA family oxidoreductase n=1 Tax=Actomonas aquatica TaxID=2866162 RepID=A0ABZ1C221_9BACT|nr:Gfo/Idh/MocA family oxidoreductase [Opitutus sp. WL0086]WRQ85519.1 Gfo/Idh/MocA family oxidoreductase [Opitutus sp. WL0086]